MQPGKEAEGLAEMLEPAPFRDARLEIIEPSPGPAEEEYLPVSYTHLTLPTNREV